MRILNGVFSLSLIVAAFAVPVPAHGEEAQGSPDAWAYLDPSQPRWNPCAKITFKVNEAQVPGLAGDARDALWRVGKASGLVFEFQGTTEFIPTQAEFAPPGTDLVVAGVRKDQTDAWSSGGAGSAGWGSAQWTSRGYRPDGSSAHRILRAMVLIDPAARLASGFQADSGGTRGELLMHEGGHIVGLGHVDDRAQLMSNPVPRRQGRWGAGDLNGLAAIGARNGCLYSTQDEAAADNGSVPPQPAGPFSSSTGSGSASPSPQPTRSPDAAPAEPGPTPTPSAASGPAKAATLTLAPSAISAGETTTVTYRGTPGAAMDILSRTQPATVFTKIGTVTLDGNGVGHSTHKPQKNTRITARAADGTMSATAPIIEVRSVASFNAKRVGSRTYTFTGRVYPALRNRLVNIYRNGSLVAQARSDASGIYTVTRTLGAGTFTFQARTPDDQYNLGATSPTRRVTIS